jgi:hypothetical protein
VQGGSVLLDGGIPVHGPEIIVAHMSVKNKMGSRPNCSMAGPDPAPSLTTKAHAQVWVTGGLPSRSPPKGGGRARAGIQLHFVLVGNYGDSNYQLR